LASSEQKIIRQILRTEFDKKRRKNPAFSQRAFAQKLGLNSGSLNAILSGKRESFHPRPPKLS
jgi:transcriptional regulator with XRE-family HTH domain